MTTPSDDSGREAADPPAVHLDKPGAGPGERGESDPPFDPYRFGKPDFPVPPEYAPPGYVPDPVPPAAPALGPYGAPPPTGARGGPPYGSAPPPPAYHSYAQPRTGNGKAVTAMVTGIASIVLFWLTFLDAILVVTAIVFGVLALAESRRRGGEGRAMAIAGLVCAAVGALAAIAATIFFLHVAGKCGGIDNSNDPNFKQCLQDHL